VKPTSRFRDALVFAAELHSDQQRKGGTVPYLAHLLAVASLALEHGADEDEAIAALLHDAVEDQGGLPTLERIRERFGDRVADVVLGCTDSVETNPRQKPPWRQRKEAYLAHLATASASVRLVSAADKVHNERSLLADYRQSGEAIWSRFKGGRDGSLWYYRALVRAYQPGGPAALAAELDRVVTELETLVRGRG
jgi:(p)ppGpp synthase/HD superfamily hydrolase